MSNLVFQANSGGSITLTGANTATTATITIPATTGTFITTGDTGTEIRAKIFLPFIQDAEGARGGSFTANNVLLGNGTSAFQVVAPGTSGNVLTSNGTTWQSSAASGQVYPGAGIANSTGSAWGTSYTTSGSGTVVALATTPTITNPTITNYVETLYAPAAGSAFTISLANGTVQQFSLNANGTLTLPSSVAGKSFTIIVTYSGTYSLTWAGGGTLKWAGGTTPTATSVNGKYDIFNFYQDGTNTYGSVYGLNY